MSEDDRAAKAARAKALLKRRREKAAGGTGASIAASHPGVSSPISPPRTFPSVPSEAIENDKRDLGDVFAKDDSDTSWLTSLPRAATPPPPSERVASAQVLSQSSLSIAAPSPRSTLTSPQSEDPERVKKQIQSLQAENASLATEVKHLQASELRAQQAEMLYERQRNQYKEVEEAHQRLVFEKDAQLQNEQQTISFLVSEKSSLTTELQRLEAIESRAQTMEKDLEEEQQKSGNLEEHVQYLQADVQEAAKLAQDLQTKERELTERYREQERQLHITTATMNELKQEAEQHQRKVRELEEQIQSDDRVERLENSLKNTQDRADELEFQLSKLKQAHTTLKLERDEIDSERRAYSNKGSELEVKYVELQDLHTGVLQQLATAESAKGALTQEKVELQEQTASMQKALAEVQENLARAMADAAANLRHLQTAQTDLRNAKRRADDAEKIQKDLQVEGTSLMRSLDEMRPKIVELTGVKLELAERIDGLEHTLRSREKTIAELETTLDDMRDQHAEAEKQTNVIITQREKERSIALSDYSELQKAYAELQAELDSVTASLHNLEVERSSHHQEATRRIEEVERLGTSLQAQTEELTLLRQELDARRDAQDEEQEFLERTQNEIESLRADLAARDEEIERLQQAASSPTRSAAPHALDSELLGSLRQQHALDLSAAQSQIRALENSVFDADTRAHTLTKQVAVLEEQLTRSHAHSRPSSRLGAGSVAGSQPRSFSPLGVHPRSSADLRRASLAGPHRALLEQGMSAETRHKRLISLSMLKARIDSEVATAGGGVSRPSSRASSVRGLSPVRSVSGREGAGTGTGDGSGSEYMHVHGHVGHKPQFLDDSHVFWCHSCLGDLVIL